MFRCLHLILAALALVVAPVAMQSGAVMAASPTSHGEMAQSGHCDEAAPEQREKPGTASQCCIAMCAAVAPLDAALVEPLPYDAPIRASPVATRHRAFLADLPTPPPRPA